MNLLKAIYCNQYLELNKRNKAYAARANGTGIATMSIVMLLFAFFMLLITFYPDFEEDMSRFVRKSFGRNSGKTVGKLGIILLILIIYPIVKYTIGSKKYYYKTIVRFAILNKDEQKRISDKGLTFFIGSILLFVMSIIALVIKSFI